MLHKALWLRNWKQSKWILFIFLCVSFYFLFIKYYGLSVNVANEQTGTYLSNVNPQFFIYWGGDSFLLQALLIFILAVVLMGRERKNQAVDFLFALPFTRKQIFLAKWYFGIVHIVGVNVFVYGLMYIVKKTTILNDRQDFTDYLILFAVGVIALCTIYTVTLYVGTFTGNSVSQSAVSGAILIMPLLLYLLGVFILSIHQYYSSSSYYGNGMRIERQVAETITIPYAAATMIVEYNDGTRPFNGANVSPRMRNENPAWVMVLNPLCNMIYMGIALLLGVRTYQRTDNKRNGAFFLHRSAKRIWMPALTILLSICFATVFSISIFSSRLVNFYISFIVFTAIFRWGFNKWEQRT